MDISPIFSSLLAMLQTTPLWYIGRLAAGMLREITADTASHENHSPKSTAQAPGNDKRTFTSRLADEAGLASW